jgi:hypothetical protein
LNLSGMGKHALWLMPVAQSKSRRVTGEWKSASKVSGEIALYVE